MTSKTVCVFTLPAPSSPSVGPNSSFYFYENTKSQNLVRMRVDTLNYTQCDSEPSGPRTRCAIGSRLVAACAARPSLKAVGYADHHLGGRADRLPRCRRPRLLTRAGEERLELMESVLLLS